MVCVSQISFTVLISWGGFVDYGFISSDAPVDQPVVNCSNLGITLPKSYCTM